VSLPIGVIQKGYFPSEIPPAFTTRSFALLAPSLTRDLAKFAKTHSRYAFHSIPRLQHSRRLLGIPNPLHQLRLVAVIDKYWNKLENHMKKSPLSLTGMAYSSSADRGLERLQDFESLSAERIIRSTASRFLLKADLSRFYHTLYTHSIPWALHGKSTAKAKQQDKTLYGNLIDIAVRNTQDKQTLGVPVGPVTSDLISELLGVALDVEIMCRRPVTKGLRYVDDYYLYFATRSEAEAALADLHSIANEFAVEINPLKTQISELPEIVHPRWKSELRSLQVRAENQQDDLITFFSRAFDNASHFPGNNVLKYAVKQSAGFEISKDSWPLYESLLLESLVAEPSLAPTLAPLLIQHSEKEYPIDLTKLKEVLGDMACYHARFKQGFEVAWALWIGKLFKIDFPDQVWADVSTIDDCVVAMLSLDLSASSGHAVDTSVWKQHMNAEHLYSENWLLAYEAFMKGWLPSADGTDYVAADDFFGKLANWNVTFYDPNTETAATNSDWLTAYSEI
jgi:hypothetical protein